VATSKTSENNIILIVVNSTKTLGVLVDYLKGYGFKVLVANDGESALTLLDYVKPDIILLDVLLPGIDGFETCRRLKSNEVTRDIPVIFITALANTLDKVRGFALGAVDYITKPIQSEEVLARLKTHVTMQSLQRTLAENNVRLQEGIAEQKKLIEELDAFAHTVAHDLKNPLATTINYAQFLQKYVTRMSQADLQKYADTIVRNGQKMGNIINELLLLASVRKEEVELEPLDMTSLVNEVKERLAYMIEEAEAEIVMPEEWPAAWGYGPWVEEIWTNYISNAIKYGGEPPQVVLGAKVKANGVVQFWVKDNGQGLSPEDQVRLFIPFTRLNQVSAEGQGLGLSIVQRIADKLGGQVGVESRGIPGEGSKFYFTLPRTEARPAAKAE
jgi:two-component system sensor histidine kinase/response regulator